MKKSIIAILLLLVLSISFLGADPKANEDATLVLALDEEKFLVGFSSSKDTITSFVGNEIKLKETVNETNLDTFSLSFDGDVYLYYKAVTKIPSNYSIQLTIENPLRLNGTDDTNKIAYSLTANKVAEKWDGTDGTNKTVSSPTLSESESTYTANSVPIGDVRASNKKNYLVTGFAKLTITSVNNSTDIPVGTYRSNVKVSIVTK